MKILIWGIPCVGKVKIGKLLAEKLNYKFFDTTEIIKEKYGTVDNFFEQYSSDYNRFVEKRDIVSEIVNNNDNFVMVVTLIYDENIVKQITGLKNTLSIELIDSVEAIYDRIVFYDENDILIPDSKEYRDKNRSHYINEIKNDQTTSYLEYRNIPKFDINNRNLEDVIDDLLVFINKISKENKNNKV